MSLCEGCSRDYFQCIVDFHSQIEKSVEFLRNHGVLPLSIECPKCHNQCIHREDGQKIWRCTASKKIPKTKKRRYCDFSTSDYKGTFLQNSSIPAWKVILFVNHWLSNNWNHKMVIKCLKFSTRTSVDWRSFCSEVTDFWFTNQQSIGGPGVLVEIDETLIVRRKYERGRVLSQVWLFGGIERLTKKKIRCAAGGSSG